MQEKLEKYFRNLLIPFILVPRSEFRNFLFASFFCHWDVVRKKINFVSCQFKTYFLTFPRIFLHPNYLIQFAFLIVQMYLSDLIGN